MYKIIEIIIISLMGCLSAGFIGWYFFAAGRKQRKCSDCAFCSYGDLSRTKFAAKARQKEQKGNN